MNYIDITVCTILLVALVLLFFFGKKKIVRPVMDKLFTYLVEEVENRIDNNLLNKKNTKE